MRHNTTVLVAGVLIALAISGITVSMSAAHDSYEPNQATQSVQDDGSGEVTVTAEDVHADQVVLHDVEVENVTVPVGGEGNQTEEAIQRAAARASGNVEGFQVGSVNIEGVSDADVSVDVESGTATVTATIEQVELEDVQADEIQSSGTGSGASSEHLERAFQSEKVSVGAMSIEGLEIESVTIERATEAETETETETETMTETETEMVTETETDSA